MAYCTSSNLSVQAHATDCLLIAFPVIYNQRWCYVPLCLREWANAVSLQQFAGSTRYVRGALPSSPGVASSFAIFAVTTSGNAAVRSKASDEPLHTAVRVEVSLPITGNNLLPFRIATSAYWTSSSHNYVGCKAKNRTNAF